MIAADPAPPPPAAAAPAAATAAAPVPMFEQLEQRWLSPRAMAWLAMLLTLLILGVVAVRVQELDFARLVRTFPPSPLFALVFVATYLLGPLSEWVIFRRLWGIPLSGIAPLLRKQVSNELLFGYLGEVQFYAWARSHAGIVTAPFGAIKDVAILSALLGNVAGLVLLVLAWPLLSAQGIGTELRPTLLSLGLVLATLLAILALRRRLLSLPRRQLLFIGWVQSLRIVLSVGLTALLWHLALPEVALAMWLLLATLRMLLSRLPFVPNKDVVFAGFAAFLLGHELQIAQLMTMLAAVLLATHLAVGAGFGAADLATSWRRR